MRRFAYSAIVAISALTVGASVAHAADTSCTGTLSGSITGNIVVPSGASCTVPDATLTGDVQVLQNATDTATALQYVYEAIGLDGR